MSGKLKSEQWSGSGPVSLFQKEARKKSFELFCQFSLRTKPTASTSPVDSATEDSKLMYMRDTVIHSIIK